MKKKLNVKILKNGSESPDILRIIGSHNGGEVPICLEDLISWGQCRRALYPLGNNGLAIERTDTESTLSVTEDGGETFTMLIEEVEINELAENKADDLKGLFTSENEKEGVI